jgi:hypothetical protein
MPTARLTNGSWPHPRRLPLGAGWNGHCTAPGHENEIPQAQVIEAFCNLGYANECAWAPKERAWDAIRFAVLARPKSDVQADKEKCSTEIRICYVCERDHRPIERGELEFDVQQSIWVRGHRDARLQKMADCFLKSHLKTND